MPQTYNVKIFKSWGGRNADASWVNNYQYVTDVPLTDSKWIDLINSVSAAEQQLHLTEVNYIHATVSTYNQEPEYNYANLRTFTLAGTGAKSAVSLAGGTWPEGTSPAADLNYALQMNKNVTLGRTGKMFYRGCLVWPNIIIDGKGKPTLSTLGANRFGPGDIMNLNQGFMAQAADFQWVMMPDPDKAIVGEPTGENPDGTSDDTIDVRLVNGLSLGGVVMLKRDHKFFDKKSAREKAAEAALLREEAAAAEGENPPIIGV